MKWNEMKLLKKKYEGFASENSQADFVGPAVRVGVTPVLIINIILFVIFGYKRAINLLP